MRIVINLERKQNGNAHSPLRIRAFWDRHPKDDMCLHNCGVELYEMFKDACASGIKGEAVLDFEGVRR